MPQFNEYPVVSAQSPSDSVLKFDEASGAVKQTYLSVPSVSALKALSVNGLVLGSAIQLLGFSTPGDGGQGQYFYDPSSAASDNGGTILSPNSGSGRWIRNYTGSVSACWFGAKGDGVNDDGPAINAAITALTRGGKVLLPAGTCSTASTILLKPGVIIQGEGSGAYDSAASEPSIIKPVAGFSPANVILADPANVGAGAIISGVSLRDLTIDMANITSDGKIAIKLLSVSNAGPFQNIQVLRQDTGQYVYIGRSANVGALLSDGITFYDLYTLSSSIDPANSNPGVIIEESNEITFLGARTKIQRRSNGAFASGSVGILVRSVGGSGVNAVNIDGAAVAGYETCVKTAYTGGGGEAPRWVRVTKCTFETYRYGIHLDGASGKLSQFCLTLGNRFISPFGSNPRAILMGYCANSTVFEDEVASSRGIEMTSDSTGNVVHSQPVGVIDAGTNNLSLGRGSTGLGLDVKIGANSANIQPGVLTMQDVNFFRASSTTIRTNSDLLVAGNLLTGTQVALGGRTVIGGLRIKDVSGATVDVGVLG